MFTNTSLACKGEGKRAQLSLAAARFGLIVPRVNRPEVLAFWPISGNLDRKFSVFGSYLFLPGGLGWDGGEVGVEWGWERVGGPRRRVVVGGGRK